MHFRHNIGSIIAHCLGVDKLLWLIFLSFAAKLLHVALEWDDADNLLADFSSVEEVSCSPEEMLENIVEGEES